MSEHNILLGVNIDHVATLRQARHTEYPDPVRAAQLAEAAGADGITIHLREDRRHIQEHDVWRLKEALQTRMNLEMAATEEMVDFAIKVRPTYVCLVPERRQELTTEGGLDVIGHKEAIRAYCLRLKEAGIQVSLFIDPDKRQIDASLQCEAPLIELHTGQYAESKPGSEQDSYLKQLIDTAHYAAGLGLTVNAGHGLNYQNVQAVAAIPELYELNIGHGIVAEAVFIGFPEAVRQMKQLMVRARS